MLKPILSEVKNKLGDDVSIIKIDVDKNKEISAQYSIQSVPTMMLFKNGTMLWRQSGVVSAIDLEKIIKQHS
jgi:thioredoxin 1